MVGTINKTVTLAITPEAIALASETNVGSGFKVTWATIQSRPSNTGPVFIRAPFVNSQIGYTIGNPGDSLVLWAPASLHLAIDLSEVFVEVSGNGDGVSVIYVK